MVRMGSSTQSSHGLDCPSELDAPEELACHCLDPVKDFVLLSGRESINQVERLNLGLSLRWVHVNLDIPDAAGLLWANRERNAGASRGFEVPQKL